MTIDGIFVLSVYVLFLALLTLIVSIMWHLGNYISAAAMSTYMVRKFKTDLSQIKGGKK
jgi:hypothetical protein